MTRIVTRRLALILCAPLLIAMSALSSGAAQEPPGGVELRLLLTNSAMQAGEQTPLNLMVVNGGARSLRASVSLSGGGILFGTTPASQAELKAATQVEIGEVPPFSFREQTVQVGFGSDARSGDHQLIGVAGLTQARYTPRPTALSAKPSIKPRRTLAIAGKLRGSNVELDALLL